MKLAFFFRDANEKYATDYPAAVGHHMSNTNSFEFINLVPAVSIRENDEEWRSGRDGILITIRLRTGIPRIPTRIFGLA